MRIGTQQIKIAFLFYVPMRGKNTASSFSDTTSYKIYPDFRDNNENMNIIKSMK